MLKHETASPDNDGARGRPGRAFAALRLPERPHAHAGRDRCDHRPAQQQPRGRRHVAAVGHGRRHRWRQPGRHLEQRRRRRRQRRHRRPGHRPRARQQRHHRHQRLRCPPERRHHDHGHACANDGRDLRLAVGRRERRGRRGARRVAGRPGAPGGGPSAGARRVRAGRGHRPLRRRVARLVVRDPGRGRRPSAVGPSPRGAEHGAVPRSRHRPSRHAGARRRPARAARRALRRAEPHPAAAPRPRRSLLR